MCQVCVSSLCFTVGSREGTDVGEGKTHLKRNCLFASSWCTLGLGVDKAEVSEKKKKIHHQSKITATSPNTFYLK